MKAIGIILIILSGFVTFFIGYKLADANMSCGIPPIPETGCYIGYCICDSDGCYWQQICN